MIDSRKVRSGDLFFALKGEKVDGHNYLAQVAQNGGVGAFVSEGYSGENYGLHLYRVKDVMETLHQMAQQALCQMKVRVIGVTGSVGKTTTKEFIATLLRKKYRVAKTPGNANSQVGLPLAILNQEAGPEFFVMEMGMERPHDIQKLISIAPPEISVITRIALAHAANFPDGLAGIARAKAEILSHPVTKLGIIGDQAWQYESVREAGKCQKRRLGELPVKCPFTASHLQENFALACEVARAVGMSWEEIESASKDLKLYPMRFETLERDGITIINDAYNANPASMAAALNNLPQPKEGGKRIGVLGEMTPLGSFAKSAHEEVAEVAYKTVDQVLCYGNECLPIVEKFGTAGKMFGSLEELRKELFSIARPGDVILIKGSNSNQLWKLLDGEKESSL